MSTAGAGNRPERQVAVITSTQYGQTTKIAAFVRNRVCAQGHHVSLFNLAVGEPPAKLDAFDATLIGAPVYVGKFPGNVTDWAKQNAAVLSGLNCAFFSVSLNAADSRPEAREADNGLLRQFLKETGLRPKFVASIAGAIHYREYGPIKRWLLKRISAKAGGPTDTSKDHELTNWSQVTEFSDAWLAEDHQSQYSIEVRLGSG